MLGYGYSVDAEGNRVADSEQTLGFFHADCWDEVKASLTPPAEAETT